MKKSIFIAMFTMFLSINLFAQKDTTLIKENKLMKVEVESYINKKGEVKNEYWVMYQGEIFSSDRTSYNRYKTSKRFGVTPRFALITNNKTKAKKIVVL